MIDSMLELLTYQHPQILKKQLMYKDYKNEIKKLFKRKTCTNNWKEWWKEVGKIK